jgi:hypothetical protein
MPGNRQGQLPVAGKQSGRPGKQSNQTSSPGRLAQADSETGNGSLVYASPATTLQAGSQTQEGIV